MIIDLLEALNKLPGLSDEDFRKLARQALTMMNWIAYYPVCPEPEKADEPIIAKLQTSQETS
jgi:hypothetical protein